MITYTDLSTYMLGQIGKIMPGCIEVYVWTNVNMRAEYDLVPPSVIGIEFNSSIDAHIIADFNKPGKLDVDAIVKEDVASGLPQKPAKEKVTEETRRQVEYQVKEMDQKAIGLIYRPFSDLIREYETVQTLVHADHTSKDLTTSTMRC